MEIESVAIATVLISLFFWFSNISRCLTVEFAIPTPTHFPISILQNTSINSWNFSHEIYCGCDEKLAGDNTDHTLHNSLTTCRRPLAAAIPTAYSWMKNSWSRRIDAIFAHTRNLVPVFAFTVTDGTLETAAAHTNVVYHAACTLHRISMPHTHTNATYYVWIACVARSKVYTV